MTIASVGVLMACMVIIGLAILVTENVNKAMGSLEQQNVVMAYMKDKNWASFETEKAEYPVKSDEEALAICEQIKQIPNVAEVTFVSSKDGLEALLETISEQKEESNKILDGDNPLSCSAKITMVDMALFEQTVNKIAEIDSIYNIQSYSGLAEKITAIKNGIGVAGVWIIGILMVIALVIVSNTIRVTMYNRKLEIGIMKAVGATDAFVRLPFVVEGMVMGLISALLAEGVLYFCYRVATEAIEEKLNVSVIPFNDVAWILLALFAIIGLFAGIIGSVIMISKYLRREGSEFAAI